MSKLFITVLWNRYWNKTDAVKNIKRLYDVFFSSKENKRDGDFYNRTFELLRLYTIESVSPWYLSRYCPALPPVIKRISTLWPSDVYACLWRESLPPPPQTVALRPSRVSLIMANTWQWTLLAHTSPVVRAKGNAEALRSQPHIFPTSGQTTLRIIKTDANGCQILKLKCIKFDFQSPRPPRGELTALQTP